jgi:hypothetical protein
MQQGEIGVQNPFEPPFSVPGFPGPGAAPDRRGSAGATLYQFGLSLLVLYLIMRYVPHGEIVGVAILAAALLTSPEALAGLLALVTNP